MISMDRLQVEVLEMMNKCTFREIRLVTNFHLRIRYNFFPRYFTHKKLSKVITYIRHDTITTTYISFMITVDKNITYIAEVPLYFCGFINCCYKGIVPENYIKNLEHTLHMIDTRGGGRLC